MVNYILDAILVLILIIGAFIGFKRGFVNTVAKPVKIIAALVIAFSTASLVSNAFVKGWLDAPISNFLTSFLTEKCAEITAANAVDELPTLIKLVARLFGINIDEVASGENPTAVIDSIVESVTDPVVTFISVIISFIVIFILLKIVLSIILAIINHTVDNGVVGFINKMLGCICTLAITFVVVWILCAISDYILAIPAVKELSWVQEFTGGYIYKFFKKINPIDLLLSF